MTQYMRVVNLFIKHQVDYMVLSFCKCFSENLKLSINREGKNIILNLKMMQSPLKQISKSKDEINFYPKIYLHRLNLVQFLKKTKELLLNKILNYIDFSLKKNA